MFKFEEYMFRFAGMDSDQLAQAKLDELLAAVRMSFPEDVVNPDPNKATVVDKRMGHALTVMQKELRGLASRVPGSDACETTAHGVFVFDGRDGRSDGACRVWDNRSIIPATAFAESFAVAEKAAQMLVDGTLGHDGRPLEARDAVDVAQWRLEKVAERGLREALERYGDKAVADAAELIASGDADLSAAMEACARVEAAMTLEQCVGDAPLDGATIVAQGNVSVSEFADPAYFDALIEAAVTAATNAPAVDMDAVAASIDGPVPEREGAVTLDELAATHSTPVQAHPSGVALGDNLEI